VSTRFDAAALALAEIQGFTDDERATVMDRLRAGQVRLPTPTDRSTSSLLDHAFTWPEFDRWQAFFAARDAFPARWDGLHVVPSSRSAAAAGEAYRRTKMDLLFEWLDTLTQRSMQVQHYARQGMRARIARQGDGQDCPICQPFEALEVIPGRGALPPFHPGCRCVLMALDAPAPRPRPSRRRLAV
jgi:hypothetical protein